MSSYTVVVIVNLTVWVNFCNLYALYIFFMYHMYVIHSEVSLEKEILTSAIFWLNKGYLSLFQFYLMQRWNIQHGLQEIIYSFT